MSGDEERKRLIGNIFSLGVLQAANYLFPLITLPYLVRVLGPEYFGLIAFAKATIAYFILLTDYGFNLSATRQISVHRHNKDKVNEIFSAVMTIKLALMFISFFTMALLITSFEKFSQHWQLFFVTFGMVVGQVLFPVWLYQGLERMKYITYLNLGVKVFFTLGVFIVVREETDYILEPLLTATGFIVAGLFSLILAKKKLGVNFTWQKRNVIGFHLTDGWHVFLSSISISLYTVSTTFFLGIFTNAPVVGSFAAADKIIQAVKGMYSPIAHAIYPVIGRKATEDRVEGLMFIKRTARIVGAVMFTISMIIFVYADEIIYYLLGPRYQDSILLLRIMAFLPFVIALSNIHGIQTMLNFGYKMAFSRILGTAAVLGVVLNMIITPTLQAPGAASVMLFIECAVLVTMYMFIKIKVRI